MVEDINNGRFNLDVMPVQIDKKVKALMKNLVACLTLIMAVLSVPAGAMVMNKLTINGWGGTPTIATMADPNSSAVVGEGATIAEGLVDPRVCLAQTFMVPTNLTGFKLDKIAIWEDGGAPMQNPYTLRLVDLGTSDPAYQGGGSQTYASGTDLWGGAMTVNYYGVTERSALEFNFENTEELILIAGHYYAFEITAVTPVGGLWWYRAAAAGSTYADGAAFVDSTNTTPGIRDQLYKGSNGRDFAMAVYFIPEPATIAVLSLGSLVLLRKRSGNKAINKQNQKGNILMKKLNVCLVLVIAFSMSASGAVTPFTGPQTNAFLSVDLNGGKAAGEIKPTEGWNGWTEGSVFNADAYGVVWSPWGGTNWSGGDNSQLPQGQEGTLGHTTSISKQFTFNGSPSTYLANNALQTALLSPITVKISAAGTANNYNACFPLDSRDRGLLDTIGDGYLFRDFIFGRKSGSNVQGTNYLQVEFDGLTAGQEYQVALYSYDSTFETSANWTTIAPTLQTEWMGWWSDEGKDIFKAPTDMQTISWGLTGVAPAPALLNLLADSSGKICVYGWGGSGVNGDQNAQNSYLNGFQISMPAMYSIPEPATIALLSIGLVLFRKRGN